jgi:putative peptidoglycan binding protein
MTTAIHPRSVAPPDGRRGGLRVAALFAASLLAPPLAFGHLSHRGETGRARPATRSHSLRSSSTSGIKSSKSVSTRKSRKSAKSKTRQRGQKVPTPDRISEIQSVLGRAGFYLDEPNGKMDAATQDALRRFQENNHLNPTGKIDALTLQKLGLGSDVAGLASPRPPLPAAAVAQPRGPSPQ